MGPIYPILLCTLQRVLLQNIMGHMKGPRESPSGEVLTLQWRVPVAYLLLGYSAVSLREIYNFICHFGVVLTDVMWQILASGQHRNIDTSLSLSW